MTQKEQPDRVVRWLPVFFCFPGWNNLSDMYGTHPDVVHDNTRIGRQGAVPVSENVPSSKCRQGRYESATENAGRHIVR